MSYLSPLLIMGSSWANLRFWFEYELGSLRISGQLLLVARHMDDGTASCFQYLPTYRDQKKYPSTSKKLYQITLKDDRKMKIAPIVLPRGEEHGNREATSSFVVHLKAQDQLRSKYKDGCFLLTIFCCSNNCIPRLFPSYYLNPVVADEILDWRSWSIA